MKYIFFLVVIILIGLAIYLLYENQEESQRAGDIRRSENNIISEISIGISGYDRD